MTKPQLGKCLNINKVYRIFAKLGLGVPGVVACAQIRKMAIKKSELYSSLWKSCDELRGGMDVSQYKDYVLVLLFIKYVSDKYACLPYAPIFIPHGASFKDLVALKGKTDISDQINKKIIAPLASANKLSDMPDFNDAGKLAKAQKLKQGMMQQLLTGKIRLIS